MISSLGTTVTSGLYDAPLQGIKHSLDDAGAAAQKIAAGDISPDSFSAMIQAGIELKANRAVAVTADQMVGTLLDKKA